MASQSTPADRIRLARLAERDRDLAGKSIRDVYGQPETKQRLEAGGNPLAKTKRRIEDALGWAKGAADEILTGATEPRYAADAANDSERASRTHWYAESAQVLEGLGYTNPDEFAQITAILDAARRREQGRTRPN